MTGMRNEPEPSNVPVKRLPYRGKPEERPKVRRAASAEPNALGATALAARAKYTAALRGEIASLGTRISVTATMAEGLRRGHEGRDPRRELAALIARPDWPQIRDAAFHAWTERLVLRGVATLEGGRARGDRDYFLSEMLGVPRAPVQYLGHEPGYEPEYISSLLEVLARSETWKQADHESLIPKLRYSVWKEAQFLLADHGKPYSPRAERFVRSRRRRNVPLLPENPVVEAHAIREYEAVLNRIRSRERLAELIARLSPKMQERATRYMEKPDSLSENEREYLIEKLREAAG
jgi:hypothetical protein